MATDPGQAQARQRRWRMPRVGLVAVALLGVMLAITGWVLDAVVAGVLGGWSPPIAAVLLPLAGGLGAVLGATRLPAWAAHLLAGLVGVALLVGGWVWSLARAGAHPGTLDALWMEAARLLDAWALGRVGGVPLGTLVVVGAFAWASGHLAGFELLRRERPAGPVVTLGTTLAVLATSGQPAPGFPDPLAAVFAGAALLLLLRADLAERRRAWVRQRLLVQPAVERRMLRAGAAVGGLAIVLAAALAGIVSVPRVDLGTLPGSIGGGGGNGTAVASVIRDRVPVGDEWVTSDAPVLAVRPADGRGRYLTRDRHAVFDGQAWTAGGGVDTILAISAGDDLPDPDRLVRSDPSSHRVGLTVTNLGSPLAALLAPAGLRSVGRAVDAHLRDRDGPPYGVAFRSAIATGGSWGMIVDEPTGDAGLPGVVATQAALGPAWLDRYRRPVAGSVLDAGARTLAAAFRDGHDEQDALHVAARLEAWFAGTDRVEGATPRFRYATSIRGVCAPGQGVVACLLDRRVGFCQQYATAMTLMLQSLGIPARYVEGFLPGSEGPDGTWTVPASAAHAWVEVHAAGVGWVRFDPTPGDGRNGQATTGERLGLLSGTPAAEATTPGTSVGDTTRPTSTPAASAATLTADEAAPDPRDPLVAAGLAVLVLLVVVGGISWQQRVRRRDEVPDRDPRVLYRALVAQATRAGLGPRGGQTELEFAAVLGTAVPDAAEQVLAIALAAVGATYGRRDPDAAALDRVAAAFRAARRSLTRVRRGGR